MPQAAAPPRPRLICKRSELFGRWDCINARQRERAKESRLAACASPSHVPSHPQTAAKVRGFSPIASGFTAETDWLLEGDGFEPSVPEPRNVRSRALFRSDRGHYRRREAPDPQHQQRGRQASEAARHKRRGVISAEAAHRARRQTRRARRPSDGRRRSRRLYRRVSAGLPPPVRAR